MTPQERHLLSAEPSPSLLVAVLGVVFTRSHLALQAKRVHALLEDEAELRMVDSWPRLQIERHRQIGRRVPQEHGRRLRGDVADEIDLLEGPQGTGRVEINPIRPMHTLRIEPWNDPDFVIDDLWTNTLFPTN